MSGVKWIKITTNMFEDEKIKLIDAMPERDTIHYVWIRLLVQAGKTNANGLIFLTQNIPYSEEMLSTIFNRPINSIRLALRTLEGFGMLTIESDVLDIVNWSKHQNIEGLDKIREQNNARQSRFRNKKKVFQLNQGNVTDNVIVTLDNATEQELDKELDKEPYTTTVVRMNEIEELKRLLKDINLTDEQAKDIYFNANGNLKHIMDIYSFSKTQRIKNMVAWLKEMVKKGVYKEPKYNEPKHTFNDYEQRTYDFDDLEKKLLGWNN
ncbi:phage replisome organizer N-terminal domain-containing protein [Clostridium sp.]|uniref:phage replisome organizer N-terminal domain-containing protein n=1 Tax=Clostridium sp. TaxID=1506 RepID=UPI003D6D3A79